MKNILIPTDFSKESKHAISYVIDFFQDLQAPCHIFLLNLYLVPKVETGRIIETNDEIKRHSVLELGKELEYARGQLTNSNIQIDTISKMGSLPNVISRLIFKNKIDLVVMGKDGGEHVQEVSNNFKASQSECPLLTVFYYETKRNGGKNVGTN